jgi:hypothetical protein
MDDMDSYLAAIVLLLAVDNKITTTEKVSVCYAKTEPRFFKVNCLIILDKQAEPHIIPSASMFQKEQSECGGP